MGVEPKGYVAPNHAVQREVAAALEAMTGARLSEEMRAIDGCAVPTYAVPLVGLARGFARLGTGQGLAPERRNAAARIRAAVAAHPFMVAGKGRFDTEVMNLLGARVFIKSGAEGVFCAALPEAGLGLAVKADDGAGRAAQVMIAALLRRFVNFDEEIAARLGRLVSPRLFNWNGAEVGRLRPVGPLA
jgi:L-asparaginase II